VCPASTSAPLATSERLNPNPNNTKKVKLDTEKTLNGDSTSLIYLLRLKTTRGQQEPTASPRSPKSPFHKRKETGERIKTYKTTISGYMFDLRGKMPSCKLRV
jgi:hypothetical protein